MAESKSRFAALSKEDLNRSTLQRFCLVFLFDSVEMELKPLLDLLNAGFTIIENGLFCSGEHSRQEIAASIPVSLTK